MLVRDVEFPAHALVTVVRVDVDKKMDRAKIGLSVLPSSAAADSLGIVNARARELQFKLLRTINIKPMPRLIFELDRGPENAAKVEKTLIGK